LPYIFLEKTRLYNKVRFNSYNEARRRRAKRPPKADETGRNLGGQFFNFTYLSLGGSALPRAKRRAGLGGEATLLRVSEASSF